MSGVIPPELLNSLGPEVAAIVVTAVAALLAYKGGKKKEAQKHIVELENNIREYLRDEGLFPSPTTSKVDKQRVDEILKENVEEYEGDAVPIRVILTDGNYYLPANKSEMVEAKRFNVFEYLPYRPDRFDCENFAAAYKTFAAFLWGTNGVATVIDWSGGHAYNIIIYATGEIEFYEPQEDRVVEIGEEEDYQMENATILL